VVTEQTMIGIPEDIFEFFMEIDLDYFTNTGRFEREYV
jgi:hypothetical protein